MQLGDWSLGGTSVPDGLEEECGPCPANAVPKASNEMWKTEHIGGNHSPNPLGRAGWHRIPHGQAS